MRQERIDELFALGSGMLHGLFPILINYSVGLMPAIFYAGITNFLAALIFFGYLAIFKRIKEIKRPDIWLLSIIVTFFIVIFPSIFIFIGTRYTSSINTAILSQAEILFAFLICGLFFGEKITWKKTWGALIILIGTLTVLYKKEYRTLVFNIGDLLIMAGTMFYPIGNHYAKRALQLISPAALLFMRSFMGGLVLLLISFIFENTLRQSWFLINHHFFYIAANSFLIIFLAKMFWYKALKRLEVTTGILILSSAPAFSLLFAVLFLRERPTVYQVTGLVTIMLGLIFLTKRDGKLPYLK